MSLTGDDSFYKMSRLIPSFGYFISTTMPPDGPQNVKREEMQEINHRHPSEMLGIQGLDLAERQSMSAESSDRDRDRDRERERERERERHGERSRIPRHRPHDTRDMDPRELLGRIKQLEMALTEESESKQIMVSQFQREMHGMEQEFRMDREGLIEKANRRLNTLMEARSVRDEKIKELELQVAELKRSISTAGHIRKQVADDELRDGMRKLGHDIQNLVVKRSRGLKLARDKGTLSEVTLGIIKETIPGYFEMESPPKNGVCQAIIARQLMRIFSVDGFFGLPSDSALSSISKLTQYFENATPAHFNEWRRLTMCLLDDVDDETVAKSLVDATDRIVLALDECLGQLLGKSDDVDRIKGIRVLVVNAIKLARVFRMQQARFNFRMPTVGPDMHLSMEPSEMEDSHGEDSPELKGRPVLFAILPAVFKFGNERGAEMDKKHTICKLRVFCVED